MSEIEKEAEETIVESTEIEPEVEENTIEESTEVLAPASSKKVKKHIMAKELVVEAKSIIDNNEEELNACKILLENDLRAYTDAKRALHVNGLDDAKALLVELGYSTLSQLDGEEENIIFESNDEMAPVHIKDVSSGKFTGLILSLLAGATTFGGLVYWATEKLGMTLDLSKKPDNETMNTIANWFSNQLGAGDNPMLGMAIVATASLLIAFMVYALRVGLKGNSNLKFANKQMKETQKYVTHKANCKIEMDRVDAHMNDAIATLKDYEVLLCEQNAKLKRILHFEGAQEEELGYSLHAKNEMKETQSMIETIQSFMAEPMSHQGKLSEETTTLLEHAKAYVQKIVSKWV